MSAELPTAARGAKPVVAVDDVSLDVAAGELLAIVGGPAPAKPPCFGSRTG